MHDSLTSDGQARRPGSPIDAGDPHAPAHPKYRPDIDGLRAIAVLSVVLFHAFPKLLPGGFVGVDIFFVISGFLISTIIFGSLQRDTFSFADFYGRRVRRIFPALSIVLIACFAFGWFYLLSGELQQLGKHIAAGAGFVSNLVLWNESGYFDNASDTKPLLHLWSLGIEEQFYIVWPLLLWLAWKIRLNLFLLCIAVAGVSFALNIHDVRGDLVADFYSPQTRFWELMLGTLLAYMQLNYAEARSRFRLRWSGWIAAVVYPGRPASNDRPLSDVESLSGLLLILAGIFALNSNSKFPGWWALLPTLGAVLMISAGPQARINRTVLGSRLFVWFGLISFPLYLWHWPLLSLSRVIEGGKPPVAHQLLSVAASILLAWLTFKLVETRIRRAKSQRGITIFFLAVMLAVGCTGYITYVKDGLPSRGWVRSLDETLSALERVKDVNSYQNLYGSRSCFQLPQDKSTAWFVANDCLTIKDPARPTVFLLGDSHSASLSLGLKPIAERYNLNLLQMSSGWCAPFGNDASDTHCVQMNTFADEQIRLARPDVLILDAHWYHESEPVFFKGNGDFIAHLVARFEGLKKLGVKKMIVVGQIPTWTSSLPDILARRYVVTRKLLPERTFTDLEPTSLQMDARMRTMPLPADTTYLSLKDALCNDAGCLTSVGPSLDKDLMVWDYGHLTRAGSIYVNDKVLKQPLLDALDIK